MKTKDTTELEKALMESTIENRRFGVSEVTIGWYGRRRVDFMTTNTRGMIICYEIKVSEPDFHSPHGHNFVGHYNYYVMPPDLYKAVKAEIPKHIGVLAGKDLKCVKRATKQNLSDLEAHNLLLYLVRSMSREVKKHYESNSVAHLASLRRRLDYWERTAKGLKRENFDLKRRKKNK